MTDIVVGANAERSRHHNRQVVLSRVRSAGEIGRAQIARTSGLSTQAVSNIIAELLEDGLIVETGRVAARRGVPVAQYALNPAGGFAAGIEIRTDAVLAALLDLCGQSVAATRLPLASPDRNSVTAALVTLRDSLLERSGAPTERILGAGVVMPGPFGATGIRGNGSELPAWDDAPPPAIFAEALGIPVIVENDANAAAIAERVSGVAQGLDTYAFIYFGSGLGLGVVHKGQLVTGAYGNAGEIGHVTVPAGGEMVRLEDAVSRLSVQRALRRAGRDALDVAELGRLFAERDPTLMAWLESALEPLAAAVAIVENLFDPQCVILGGAMPDEVLDHLVCGVTLAERSVSNRRDRSLARLVRGKSGRMTATLGGAALVINQAFTPRISAQP